MQNSPTTQGIQPTTSMTVTFHKQWLTLYRDFNTAILSVFHFSCPESGGEIFLYTLLYTLVLCSPSPTKQEKQMHFLQGLVPVWVWKDQSLAAPSSSAWVVEAKDEPDLILRALPHHPPCLTHPPCCLKSNGDPKISVPAVLPSTARAPWCSGGSPQLLLLAAERWWHWHSPGQEMESSPHITWLQEGHLRHTGTLEAQRVLSLLFLMRNNSLQVWHFQSFHSTGKNHGSSSNCFGGSGCAWWRWDARTQPGAVGLVLWADTGQLAILAAHCWKMAYLSLASSTLSVCLSVCLRL